MESSSSRRPCFVGEYDDGLASVVDMEAGVSGFNGNNVYNNMNYGLVSRSMGYGRRSSLRNLTSLVSSPRSVKFYESRFEEHHHQQSHFLEACFLCKKALGGNRDIFMYRGDTPFCSEECRQEQIEIDEAKEKNWNRTVRRSKDQKKSTSPTKAQEYPSRAGTVAAA